MSKTPLLGYGGNLGNSAASSLLFPDLSALPAFVQQTGIQSLRLCYSAGAFLYGDPAYAEGLMACAKTLAATGCEITLAIDHLDNTVRLGDGSPQHRLTVQEVVQVWDKLLSAFPDFVMDINEIGQQLGEGPNQPFIDFLSGVGRGIHALHPGCKVCLPCPGFSNTIEDLDHDWGGKTVYQTIVDAWGFAPHYVPVHDYSDGTDVARVCQSRTDIPNIVAQEWHDAAEWREDDQKVLLRSTPTQERTSARLAAYKACGVTAAFGWAYCNPVYENISYGWPTLNGEGQLVDTWYKQQAALATVALPWLNPLFYAQSPSASLRDGTDLFDYFQPTPDTPFHFDLQLSVLTEAQKAKLRVDVESQQAAGNTADYGGAGTDNRAVADYAYYGSADGGKTWTLVPNVAAPAPLAFTPNPVVGTTKRWNCHWLDCAGFDILRFACTRARGQQGDQFSVQFDFYDASSCSSQTDFSGTDGVTLLGDSTDTFVFAFVENFSDALATPSHPHPPAYENGQPFVQAHNYLTDDLNNYKEVLNEKPGRFVVLITGANDVPSLYWFTSLDGLIALNRAAGKVTLLCLPLCPTGPDVDDGSAAYKVRRALLANYDTNGNVTASGGTDLYTYLVSRYAGQPDVIVSDALFQWSHANPGVMNPNDLHEADMGGWRETLAAEIRLRCFGYDGPAYTAPAPPAPVATAEPAEPGVDTAPTTATTPAPVATQTITTPVVTPPATTTLAATALPLTAQQLNALLSGIQSLYSQVAGLLVTATAQEQAQAAAAAGLVNTGQEGWLANGAAAVTLDPTAVASCAALQNAAYISLNPNGQVDDGLYTFTLKFTAAQVGTLRGQMAASNLVKSITLNGKEQPGIPYIDYTAAKPFAADGVRGGENTLQIVVQRIGQGLGALCVALSPLDAPTA